jgi:hypothetical protein
MRVCACAYITMQLYVQVCVCVYSCIHVHVLRECVCMRACVHIIRVGQIRISGFQIPNTYFQIPYIRMPPAPSLCGMLLC